MINLENVLKKLGPQNLWGTYYLGQYYFTIVTHLSKDSLGIEKIGEISLDTQRFLQSENYIAIFHEYIHYLHEMSTVIGNLGLGIDLSAKAIFSRNFNTELKSAEVFPITDRTQLEQLAKLHHTQFLILGDTTDKFEDRRFIRVSKVSFQIAEISVPFDTGLMDFKIEVPLISFQYSQNAAALEDNLFFGKFYLYEGLAYELDRIVDKHIRNLTTIDDIHKRSEYTVLRDVAKFVYPEVDTYTFLCLASLALQHLDCGRTFILLLERIKYDVEIGVPADESLTTIKAEVSNNLTTKQQDFNDAQEEYWNVFKKRKQLYKSFDFLTEKIKHLYAQRIQNPTFEIDLIFENNELQLIDLAELCDFMYLFNDDDDFMRDFLGTTIDQETSMALKALLSYDHYHKAHLIYGTAKVEETTEHKCPFYYCCGLDLRKDNPEICGSKPWRIFEVSANTTQHYCWYGTGVAEFKSHTER